MKRLDVWQEMDKANSELLEFVRSQIPYTEAELLEKPLHVFMDIVERANKRAEQSARANRGAQK